MFKFPVLLLCSCSFLCASNHLEQIKMHRYICEKSYNSVCEALEFNYTDEPGYQILMDQKNLYRGNIEAFDICINILEK